MIPMLVLSRKTRQQILIPGLDITITVLDIGGNRVQLGIDAPRHVQVTRPEVERPATATPADNRARTRILAGMVCAQ